MHARDMVVAELPISSPSLSFETLRSALLVLFAVTFVVGGGGGCPSRAARTMPPLEIIASPNANAEADFRAAKQAWQQGDRGAAYQRFRAFLDVWPNDPLVPFAKLSLGRIDLESGHNEDALRWFAGLEKSEDPAMAERARMYGAIARAQLGEYLEALSVLKPLIGRTIDPQETSLLLSSVVLCQEKLGDTQGALETLDRSLRSEQDAARKQEASLKVAHLVDQLEPDLALPRAYEILPRDGEPWRKVAARMLMTSHAHNDLKRVREIADDMREQGITLDEGSLSLVLRAERSSEADPAVIGAILPLSGRGREVGEAAMRGILLASGVIDEGARPAFTPRIVFRDDEGNPDKAAQALTDLAALHRVIAVIGPVSSVATQAVITRARELELPLISLSPADANSTELPPLFRISAGARDEAKALVAIASARGAKRFALLSPQGGYGDAMRTAFGNEIAAVGGTLLAPVSYPATQTSFVREADAVAKMTPDAVIIADAATRVSLIAPALNVVGLFSDGTGKPSSGRAVSFLITSLGFDKSLKTSSRRSLQGAIFAVPFDPDLAPGFVSDYRAQWNTDPNLYSALGHDAYRILQAGLRTQATTRAALTDALKKVQASDAVGAADGFTQTGESRRPIRLETLQGQAFVMLQ